MLQTAVYLLFHRRFFPNDGELFTKRKSRLEWQTVFPKNLLSLVVFVFVSSLTGLLLIIAGITSWISIPFAAMGGIAFNFLLNTAIAPIYFKIRKQGEPTPEQLENMDGIVTEDITEEMYGEIKVNHGGREYRFRALSANGRELPKNTEIIVIYSEDGACFVESRERFFDPLFEENGDNPASQDFQSEE